MENKIILDETERKLTEIVIDEVRIVGMDNIIKFTNFILEMKKQHNLIYTVSSLKLEVIDY